MKGLGTLERQNSKYDPKPEQSLRSSTGYNTDSADTIEMAALAAVPDLESYPGHVRKSTPMTRAGAKLQATFPRLAQAATKTAVFVRGPRPKVDLADPRPLLDVDWTVRGRRYFVPIESMVMRRTQPFTKPWVFAIIVVAYIIGLAFLSKTQSFDTPADSFIGCTSSYWRRNDDCGLDGEGCGGVPDNSTGPETFDYRCPAQCDNVILQNFRTVGNEQVAFVPLVVGGGDAEETYRGDSFICAAAIQAGVISSSKGGCFSLELVANHTNFAPRNENGLASLGFPTIFPLGFRFTGGSSISNCEDIRNQVLAFNVIMSALLFFLFRPHGLAVFWSLVCIGFWHVTLFSQPRSSPPSLSFGFGTFLPTLFICYAFWRLAFRFTLPVFLHKAPLEAAVWYLGPFWVGVLFNLTFDRIPISRLVASDISQRAGGVASLVIMIIVLATCVITQVIVIRKTGWLPHYLKWYIIGGLVLMVLALLPNLQLRIHHYIFAMVFLPGTAFPTRLSAIFQGVLLGMFLNGAAAFGYDSILQTAAELLRDATLGSEIPEFLTTAANFNSTLPLIEQTLRWAPLPDNSTWDGFSLLVDDVERYVGPAMEFSLALFDPLLPHFFRLALTSSGVSGDFTMPATLWPNGTWVDPLEGAT